MLKKQITKSAIQTKKLGGKLARKILETKLSKKAFVIGLEGDLGSGKTTFLQGFAKGLSIKEKILSPTFVIMRRFKLKNSPREIELASSLSHGVNYKNFFHFDCYRIRKPKELLDLGFKEIISSPQSIIAIEWSEKIKKILPQKAMIIKFKFINEKSREIKLDKGL